DDFKQVSRSLSRQLQLDCEGSRQEWTRDALLHQVQTRVRQWLDEKTGEQRRGSGEARGHSGSRRAERKSFGGSGERHHRTSRRGR
ncbi:hypothetical protein HK104_006800, partial [Borealophlyctis nickersoniae]